MAARQSAAEAEAAAEEWRARAEALAEEGDALLFSECVLKTRLFHFSLDFEQRRQHFPVLATRFRRHFQLLHAQCSEEELLEAFEEAVEDWGRLCEMREGSTGWEETAEQRRERLAETMQLAQMLFDGLEEPLTTRLARHVGSAAFSDFLQQEFGNADVLRCLEDNAEMEDMRRALAEEERLNPFIAELRESLGEALGGAAAEVSPEGTLAALVDSARSAQDFSAVLAFLDGLGLEGVERPASPDLPGWERTLASAAATSPEAARLLQALQPAASAATQAL